MNLEVRLEMKDLFGLALDFVDSGVLRYQRRRIC
jgi:hypothetical protein